MNRPWRSKAHGFGSQEAAMRCGWIMSIIGSVISGAAFAGEPFVQSNDTGGIISWSCEAEGQARAIAAYELHVFELAISSDYR